MRTTLRAVPGLRVTLISAVVFACLILVPRAAWAQSNPAEESRDAGVIEAPSEREVAPVKVDGNTLFFVVGTTSLPAKQRAVNIGKRIIKSASDSTLDVTDITIIDKGNGRFSIAGGGLEIVSLQDEDAALESIDLQLLADLIRDKIVKSITAYRFERSRGEIIRKILYSIGALLLATFTALFLNWLLKRMNAAIEKRIGAKIESMENKSFHLVRSTQIWRIIHVLLAVMKVLLIVIVILSAVVYGLSLFPWTRGTSGVVLDTILTPLIAATKAFVRYLPSLAFLVIIFFVTRYLLKLLNLLFTGVSKGRIRLKSMEPELALPTYGIIRILVLMFALVVAYPYIPGSQSPAFKALSVFVGVLISLGSSSFIGNAIAGYSMTFRKAFRPGDRIMVDGNIGFVEEQKTMVTRIRTVKNEEIVMPNSVLINSSIINFSTKAKQTGVILHSSVNIGYESPWRQVEAILLLAADRTAGLQKDPVPFVLKKSLGEIAIEYEINGYCKDPTTIARVYNELHGHMLDLFNENSIQIMRPSYEGDPDSPKLVPKEHWYTPVVSSDPTDITETKKN